MDTELKKLKKLSSLKFENYSGSFRFPYFHDGKYTSLKDVLPHSPTFTTATNYEGNGFDSSSICIRNQLVKQAASAYLQSAYPLNRHQHWLARFWGRVYDGAALHSRWNIYVGNPLRACTGRIIQFLASILRQIGTSWCLE
ncbi:E3 ubiquitin-protein ligase arkadia-a protein [Thalictrum thalictroides]|uniref:E3 ubiquitin-protein ligase arkadia-a protein n=1 Tax=Thalictrum thalictroides TaxID=46969 RepID=A0A7J6VPQ9_THATH|nr:E3 ubiquitin-protein ligase arkadia-a protein [Thalictrum thalictroides]